MQRKEIAVFGGRHPRPGDPEYEEARRLGRLLASADYAVLNGGYVGIMEAVSLGARSDGLSQALGDLGGFLFVCFRQDQQELLAAVPPDQIVQTQR